MLKSWSWKPVSFCSYVFALTTGQSRPHNVSNKTMCFIQRPIHNMSFLPWFSLNLPIFYTYPYARNTSVIFRASRCMRMHIAHFTQYRQKHRWIFRDPQDCENFPLKKGFCSVRGPFMTGFTVYRFNTSKILFLKCNSTKGVTKSAQ